MLQTKLAYQEGFDRFGNLQINAREDTKKSGRTEHQRKAEPIMATTQPIGDLPVASIQVEIPRQLISGRYGDKIGIALPLLIGQVAGGHIVRNLGLLRRVREARKMLDIFLAKYLCESQHFSNMFSEVLGAPA